MRVFVFVWTVLWIFPAMLSIAALVLGMPLLLLNLLGLKLLLVLALVVVGFAVVATAIACLVGYFRYWYYSWLACYVVTYFVLFVLGCVLAVACFQLPFTPSGALPLVLLLAAVLLNKFALDYIQKDVVRTAFRVNEHAEAEPV